MLKILNQIKFDYLIEKNLQFFFHLNDNFQICLP